MLAAMDSHPNSKPTPSAKSNVKSSVYHISSVPVEFPYKPYGSQLAFMSRVISTLDRARQQGHCHALLESPTGTGKTLSLLCSSLAWQRHQGRQLNVCISPSNASEAPEIVDPLLHGGGFIPDPHPYVNSEKPLQATKAKNQKKNVAPKIYYASRTHSQISQVIREYRKTSYRVPMAVLASRKHYCTNKYACSKENVDEICKSLLKDSSGSCLEFKNANKVKSHPSLQIGECFEVHDVEDLVRIGRRVKGCSYFAAQSLAADAKLVFCPYSYVINPIVRRAMDVDIKGCILILDEAHNIEDMAREGGSVDIEEEVLHALQEELGQLCMDMNLVETYRPLYDVIEGIVSWINIKKDNLQKYEFERYISYWTGEKAKQELHKTGISQYCFPVLQECAMKVIKEAIDAAPGDAHLTGISLIALEGLFSSLSYFFSGNGCHANDYQLALQRCVKRDGSNADRDWTISLSLWCLNPAVVFNDIANLSLSVILTSGTLSPVGSFSSELGVRFDSCMEAPHVINMESQLWAAVVTSGAGNVQLNASYKTADSYAFQDSLGATLEEICKIVPGGALVFFPSYKLLEKLHDRWHQTGQWSKLNMQKDFFIEPRGSSSDLEPVLKDYYDTICGKSKPAPGKIRIGLKRTLKFSGIKDSNQNPNKGAAFLAVCRGKVSEGIDFSDDNARVVVIVGIPFPNKNDIQVMLKKKFNDTYKSSKNLLSGSEWYCHQAFRALNQAAGRCIRHRFDYGAIILLDERYTEQRNLLYVSKWLRSSIKTYKNFDDSLKGLQTFFREAKQQQNLEANFKELSNISSNKEKLQPSNQATEPVNNLVKVFNNYTGKNDLDKTPPVKINKFTMSSTCLLNDNSPVLQPQTPINTRKTAEQINEKFLNLNRKVDFQTESLNATFSSQSNSSGSNPHLQMVVEGTPCDTFMAEPFTRLETLHQFSLAPLSESLGTTSKELASPNSYALAETPKKLASPVFFDAKQDPHFDMDINSNNQKKRRLMHLQNTSHDHSDAASSQFTLSNSIVIPKDIDKASENEKVKQLSLISESQNTSFRPSSNDCEEMELHVSCMSCRKPMGLPENRFLVKGIFVVSSKGYLSYTNLHKSLVSFMPDSLSKIPPAITHVLSSEITVINERIIRALPNNFSAHGVWCEEDGCVFRPIFCPFCTDNDNCLGVRVLATDATNINLLNKVLFFVDRLCIIKPKALNEKAAGNNHPKLVEIEKFAYKEPQTEPVYLDTQPRSGPYQPKSSSILITSRSKLKLPRRLSDSSNMNNSRMEEETSENTKKMN